MPCFCTDIIEEHVRATHKGERSRDHVSPKQLRYCCRFMMAVGAVGDGGHRARKLDLSNMGLIDASSLMEPGRGFEAVVSLSLRDNTRLNQCHGIQACARLWALDLKQPCFKFLKKNSHIYMCV